ncbi:MAG: glycosyltransferase family 2 protein [Ruminiclostridium sp.]|nr:glycosyltransferase family 2 protein [Ruminiclostridium sp.]
MPENESIPDISVVLPCLNEEAAVGASIDEAKRFADTHGLRAEIIVVDNGSEDGSAEAARSHGAAVIPEPRRGYGRAIRTGIERARGRVIVFADCDTTYDLLHLERFYYPLVNGEYDVMIGDRLDSIEKGAMPLSHRVGVRFLSACGRRKFRTDVRDFHCGLRSVTHAAADKCVFETDGMVFATEMIAECVRKGLRIGQTPTVLRRCGFPRRSKLRAVSDGLAHLRYIFRA